MKKQFLPILCAALSLAVSCKKATVTNGSIKLEFDSQMRLKVTSTDPSVDTFYSSFVAPDAIVADETTIDTWRLKSVERNSTDNEDRYTLTGVFDKNGFEITKIETVTAPKDFDGMVIVETAYVNRGDKPLSVAALESNRLRVASSETVWSFEPSSTSARKDWILPVDEGFSQRNYLGMNNCDYGGGIPMVTLWRRDGGISTGLVEPVLKLISMPVEHTRYSGYAQMKLRNDYAEKVEFAKGDTLRSERSFISVSRGDYYNPLSQFSAYMQRYEGFVLPASEPEAFEPVWCAWGYERNFTIDEVLGTLPKVKELGFKWVDVDDGYQIAEGDWQTNSRFRGDADMRRLTGAIHSYGLKTKIWWAPLAADPGTKALEKHPEMMLLTKEYAPEYITWWNSYYLSPVNPQTQAYTADIVEQFLKRWDFDGFKLDGQHLNCCAPDYNENSGLDYPEQAIEQLPTFFKAIYDQARSIKPHAVVQLCPCGCAINFFNMPYFNQAVASDPTSSAQIRMKCKTYKAINPNLAYYADHVELSDGGMDFATQVGVGGVIGSKFTYPKNNPSVKGDYLLTPEKEKVYKKWVSIYNSKMLSRGEYLNLYDIAFDKPEAHVIAKDGKIYYAFYASEWDGGSIELRGLDADKRYQVTEYAADKPRSYTIDGNNPYITPEFKVNYLIEVSPI